MLEWQQRIIVERNELKDKLDKLVTFIHENPAFQLLSVVDQELLEMQEHYMTSYNLILDERIERFQND